MSNEKVEVKKRSKAPVSSMHPPNEYIASGLNFSGELPENRELATAYKKKEPEVTYEILRIQRDGKNVIKVLEKSHYVTNEKHRSGVTESKLCFQMNGGKQVAGFYTIEQLRKKGVKI